MSAKFSAQRRNAFLRYLSQTGNVTLSAERAKVSRSWVRLHRSGDAEFDGACLAAIAEAKRALEALASPPLASDAPSPQPLSREGRGAKWKYFEGHELVVRGTGGSGGGKRVQIGRAREKQWTPRAEKRFLAALTATCNVKAACAEVGMWPPSAYSHRQRWPAFFELWKKAEQIGFLRIEAAVVEEGGNLFSEREVEPEIKIEGMTIWHAMQVLNMHRHQVRGTGGRPGQPPNLLASDDEMVHAMARGLRLFGVNCDAEVAQYRQAKKRAG